MHDERRHGRVLASAQRAYRAVRPRAGRGRADARGAEGGWRWGRNAKDRVCIDPRTRSALVQVLHDERPWRAPRVGVRATAGRASERAESAGARPP